MPIGNPIVREDAFKTVTVIASAGQTIFTITGGYKPGRIEVYLNGVKLVEGTDFTASDESTVSLSVPAALNDELQFVTFDSFSVQDALVAAASTQNVYGDISIIGDLYVNRVFGAGQVVQIGIQSAGTLVGYAKTLNFVGTGNTFLQNGDTIDISISSGGGGGGGASAGTVINYPSGAASPFILSLAHQTENINLDDTTTGEPLDANIVVGPSQLVIDPGIALTVGEGKTLIPDLYDITRQPAISTT